MAAAWVSSVALGPHPWFGPFSNPSARILRPLNPSRRISCSADENILSPQKLGSNQRYTISLGCTPRESEQRAMRDLLKIQRTQIDKEFHADERLPAMVSCSILAHVVGDYETKDTSLVFSTLGSDGALLKEFSILCLGFCPFVLSACRDLVLVDYHNAFLCNVATEELITLPNISDLHGPIRVCGFGYVPSTKEFKLLSNPSPDELGGFKVLTVGADRWRDVEDPLLFVFHYSNNRSSFVNGAIHLRTKHKDKTTSSGACIFDDRIATFNLESEEWGWIAGPPIPSIPLLPMKELSGYLCIVDTRHSETSIDIWLLKDYYNGSWVKECTINLSDLIINDLIVVVEVAVIPLALQDDGKILLQVETESLQLYDPKTKSSSEIYRFNDSENIYLQVYVLLLHYQLLQLNIK